MTDQDILPFILLLDVAMVLGIALGAVLSLILIVKDRRARQR
jgi:hypothetical protein